MRANLKLAAAPLICLALAACGGDKKAPTGQVVATVDGQEITSLELRSELEGITTTDPRARKAAEQQALQMIIARKILAKEAENRKLDKTPDFALQEQRALEALKAQTLQKAVLKSVPEPTQDEAEAFVASNRDLFAERKVFAVDQIRIARPSDPSILKAFEPLKTFEEVEALLQARGIPYQKGADRIDSVGNNPKLVEAILKLPPNEVFVLPVGQLIVINRVKETKIEPFTGEPAVKYALSMMKAQRQQEAVARELSNLVKAGQAKTVYNKAYAPPKPAAKGAAPAQKAAPAQPAA